MLGQHGAQQRAQHRHKAGTTSVGDSTLPDLASVSDDRLKDLVGQLTEREQAVSYERRILHGKIDILRAELVNRLKRRHERDD